MQSTSPDSTSRSYGSGDILAVGFGTAAVMWGLGFLSHLPLGSTGGEQGATAAQWVPPAPLMFALLLVVMLAGGWFIGRFGTRGWRGGLYAGIVTGLVDLLVLGSVLRSLGEHNLAGYALLWAPIMIVIAAALGAIGASFGAQRTAAPRSVNWACAFALVALGATLLLIAVGGTVTGTQAGLAVPDWPNTFGYNMFLFPLSKMTGGIYFEHSHRLLGSLVGLITLVLTIYLYRHESRRWVAHLMLVAFVLVCVQGLLGALRVTGHLTLSTDRADMAPSAAMALLHGTLAQLIFALLAIIACTLSAGWRSVQERYARPGAANDRILGLIALLTVLVQIALGVVLRQRGLEKATWALHAHITVAIIAAIVVTIYGLRVWGIKGQAPGAPRLAKLVLHVLGLQLVLGLAALGAVLMAKPHQPPAPLRVLVTTVHQVVAAMLFGLTAASLAWHLRTVRGGRLPTSESAPISPAT